jgi:uncharacterized membrane protein
MRKNSDNTNNANGTRGPGPKNTHPFRRAVLRGLAVVLPPLLTIVILVWVWNTVLHYVLEPMEGTARQMMVWYMSGDVLDRVPDGLPESDIQTKVVNGETRVVEFTYEGKRYVTLDNGQAIPKNVYQQVSLSPGKDPPRTAEAYYDRFVKIRYLQRHFVIPFLLAIFILVLYLLGKFLAVGVGRFAWGSFERQILNRLPVIRHVYSSVKQVTDFIFSERDVEYTRVVAVEYPRQGIWSLGFVTGDSMIDISAAANEPVISVLIPTSPMPATGYCITVRKSDTIDLDISVDQAFQFIISCGVVVPPQQNYTVIDSRITPAIADRIPASDDDTSALPPPAEEKSAGE